MLQRSNSPLFQRSSSKSTDRKFRCFESWFTKFADTQSYNSIDTNPFQIPFSICLLTLSVFNFREVEYLNAQGSLLNKNTIKAIDKNKNEVSVFISKLTPIDSFIGWPAEIVALVDNNEPV